MNQWVSIVALTAWLVLALSAYRTHQVEGRTTLVFVLGWISIFFLTVAVFTLMSPRG